MFIYDGHPGGVGITRLGFQRSSAWCANATALICECPCRAGCPSCVQSPKCGNLNEPLNKNGALELLHTACASLSCTPFKFAAAAASRGWDAPRARHLPRRPGPGPATAAAAGAPPPRAARATPTEGGAHYGETPKVHGLASLPHLRPSRSSRPTLTATVSFRIASKLAVRDVRL